MNATLREVEMHTDDPELQRLEILVCQRVSRRVRALKLGFDGGGIVLRGWAPSFYIKQMAQQAVMEATDLPIRANEIEVG
jgi:hypothetical protein